MTKEPLKEARFIDGDMTANQAIYLIKSRVLQPTASGTYYNTSQGTFLDWSR